MKRTVIASITIAAIAATVISISVMTYVAEAQSTPPILACIEHAVEIYVNKTTDLDIYEIADWGWTYDQALQIQTIQALQASTLLQSSIAICNAIYN